MRTVKTQARPWPLVAAVLAAAPVAALADAVVLKNRLRYEPVTVEAVADGAIAFRLRSGRAISKSLTEVATIRIDGEGDFNQGEELMSVAGVHVFSRRYRVAALGNIATHPQARGKGLARVVTAKLCQELRGEADHIGLNVKDDNAGAIACYERLGFERCAVYGEYTLEAM